MIFLSCSPQGEEGWASDSQKRFVLFKSFTVLRVLIEGIQTFDKGWMKLFIFPVRLTKPRSTPAEKKTSKSTGVHLCVVVFLNLFIFCSTVGIQSWLKLLTPSFTQRRGQAQRTFVPNCNKRWADTVFVTSGIIFDHLNNMKTFTCWCPESDVCWFLGLNQIV